MKQLLLLSNSTNFGEEYLAWALPHLRDFRGEQQFDEALFIPYAGFHLGYDEYTNRVSEAVADIGIKVKGIHEFEEPAKAIAKAKAIFVGGGNTFYLLKTLQSLELIKPIQKMVKSGTPYVGWSAGSNLACPSIRTTNDMPIVEPGSFKALSLLGVQINPHFTDQTIEGHGGESRTQRINEFLKANSEPVLALSEGSLLKVNADRIYLKGSNGFLFTEADKPPKEIKEGKISL